MTATPQVTRSQRGDFRHIDVKIARDWRRRPLPLRAAAYGRLPLQAPLIAWALHVAREARRPRPGAAPPPI